MGQSHSVYVHSRASRSRPRWLMTASEADTSRGSSSGSALSNASQSARSPASTGLTSGSLVRACLIGIYLSSFAALARLLGFLGLYHLGLPILGRRADRLNKATLLQLLGGHRAGAELDRLAFAVSL